MDSVGLLVILSLFCGLKMGLPASPCFLLLGEEPPGSEKHSLINSFILPFYKLLGSGIMGQMHSDLWVFISPEECKLTSGSKL